MLSVQTAALAYLGLAFACGTAAQANISISIESTQNVNCAAGICTPTAKTAVLNVGDLTNMLASGDLTVQAGDGKTTADGLEIDDGFSWATHYAS